MNAALEVQNKESVSSGDFQTQQLVEEAAEQGRDPCPRLTVWQALAGEPRLFSVEASLAGPDLDSVLGLILLVVVGAATGACVFAFGLRAEHEKRVMGPEATSRSTLAPSARSFHPHPSRGQSPAFRRGEQPHAAGRPSNCADLEAEASPPTTSSVPGDLSGWVRYLSGRMAPGSVPGSVPVATPPARVEEEEKGEPEEDEDDEDQSSPVSGDSFGRQHPHAPTAPGEASDRRGDLFPRTSGIIQWMRQDTATT
eukprot:CAMPEP_0171069102 /NCGR_PEP_ID=MMETSP0766_2-20121228/8952_1 /TAXON_ID=439317 /ORGANISM="Gambierdiscus australes, Strain CAWD 149" /LENGTH=253 /DNA_ID=CAMNT_0011525463 /DNA_START=98 /DNA_END=855 /DNA_ORIENTATION=-